jgi:hypothetical protein
LARVWRWYVPWGFGRLNALLSRRGHGMFGWNHV